MADRLVAVLHPVHGPISELEAKSALSGADRLRFTRSITLDALALTREDTLTVDWIEVQRVVAREHDEQLAPIVRDGAALAYFGLAPIPVAMQLGYLLEEWPRVDAYQRLHDSSTSSWGWADTQLRAKVVVSRTHDVVPIGASGNVAIRISTWHAFDIDATRAVLPGGALLEVDISLERPGADALASVVDLRAIATSFRSELDAISDAMPAATIHVFAAVPVGLALELGRAVSPTKHRPVQTYQFNGRGTPKYRPALLLQDVRTTTPRSTTSSEVERATQGSALWTAELASLAAAARSSQRGAWATALALREDHPWRALPNLAELVPVLTTASVDARLSEFAFDRADASWRLGPDLVLGVEDAIRDEADRKLAVRLFFEHEGLHHEWHGLTAGTSAGVGRLPRVLEELDYQADAWAMLQELARTNPSADERAAVVLARRMVDTAIAMFWAFDRGESAIREIQVRRLNRYLIWYWQALRLERASGLADVVAALTSKPTLEVAGLQPTVVGERVVYPLDRVPDRIEVGVFANDMMERRSDGYAYDVRAIVTGFRDREGAAIKQALRSVFDNVHARARRGNARTEEKKE